VDVIFGSEREADESLKVLKSRKATIADDRVPSLGGDTQRQYA
jgi:hypothetical protein